MSPSPSTLIFGGHGKTAQQITRLLIAAGHTVHSVIRNPSQIPDIKHLGANPHLQDITSASVHDMTSLIKSAGVTTVIWCASAGVGATPDEIRAVDAEGCIKTQDAASQVDNSRGAMRYISVSALDVRDREKVPFPPWYDAEDRAISERVSAVIKPHLDAKLVSDRSLVTENDRRGLRYTIVRPNGLTQGEAKGQIEAGKVHLGRMVPRADVAAVVMECLRNGETEGLVFDVVGGETSIADAVGRVAKDREDSFEGTY